MSRITAPIARAGQYATADAEAAATLDEIANEKPSTAPDEAKDPSPEMTSVDRWRKNIAAVGLTEAQADSILDALMRQGYWEKELVLFRGKLKVTLRTRDAYSNQRVTNALDQLRNATQQVYAQTVYRYNLSGSLSKYGDTVLAHPKRGSSPEEQEKLFLERIQFIDSGIPDPMHTFIAKTLEDFDKVVYAALSEGAASVF